MSTRCGPRQTCSKRGMARRCATAAPVPPNAHQVALFLRDGARVRVPAGRRPARGRARASWQRWCGACASCSRRSSGSPPTAGRAPWRGAARSSWRSWRRRGSRACISAWSRAPTRYWKHRQGRDGGRAGHGRRARCRRAWSCASTSCRGSAGEPRRRARAGPPPCCARWRRPRRPERAGRAPAHGGRGAGHAAGRAKPPGGFALPDDVAVVREVRELLERLGDARLELRSDHVLNLLPQLEGSLPGDRERLLALLDGFLSLSPDDRPTSPWARAGGLPLARGTRRPAEKALAQSKRGVRRERVDVAARALARSSTRRRCSGHAIL